MNKKVFYWGIAAAMAVALSVAVLLALNTRKQGFKDNEIKIGALLPLTGGTAYVGESCRHGIELAIASDNKANSNNIIRVIYADSANDPKTGLSAFRKLHDIDNTQINICVMSAIADAVLAQDANQPILLSVVSNSQITRRHPQAYRYFLSSDKETKAMAAFFAKKGARKAAFLYINDDFGLDARDCFVRYFTSGGGEVVYSDSFDKSGERMVDVVVKALASEPDAIYLAGYGTPLAIITQRLKDQGYTGIIGAFSGFSAPTVLAQVGRAAEGVFVSTTGFDPSSPQTSVQTEFVQDYEKAYGKKPDHYAAYCYDLTKIFLKCLHDAKGNISEALAKIKNVELYPGVIGKTTIDEYRDFQFPVMIKMVSGGKLCQP